MHDHGALSVFQKAGQHSFLVAANQNEARVAM